MQQEDDGAAPVCPGRESDGSCVLRSRLPAEDTTGGLGWLSGAVHPMGGHGAGAGAEVGGALREVVAVPDENDHGGEGAFHRPFFLQPYGGDLEGFFIVRGDGRTQQGPGSDEFQRLAVRAQAIVSSFGVIDAITGDALNKHMAWFTEAAPGSAEAKRAEPFGDGSIRRN